MPWNVIYPLHSPNKSLTYCIGCGIKLQGKKFESLRLVPMSILCYTEHKENKIWLVRYAVSVR
jgi:hypothetical protein